ncbi:MAG TPA: glucose-6-phosphate isomerase [Clostridia bacterium]|nr:glucose-6-phosphate isomerase [Clostridia bacterium]
MAEIQFNFDNVMENRVGDDGLRPGELDEKAAKAAVAAFHSRVQSGDIGFPLLPEDTRTATAISEFADDLRPQIDDVLLVGIGGSALGAYALDVAMRGPHPVQSPIGNSQRKATSSARPGSVRPRLVVLDNVDPGLVAAALDGLNPKRTAVCVIAKSGSTAETLSTFMIVREWLTVALGKKARSRIIAITDAQKGDLLAIARQEQYPLFFVPSNVGGRFSVFSTVGLVPAALIGLDIKRLLRGAKEANARCWQTDVKQNPALASALVHHALNTKRRKSIEVVFAYSSYMWGSAFWYRQLWAESLGKRVNRNGDTVECGQTPVAALGVTDQHSQVQLYIEGPRDKMITFWEVAKPRVDLKIPRDFLQYDSCRYLAGKKLGDLFSAERRATEAALTEVGRPNCRWTLPRVDEQTMGAFFQMLEFQTAFAGELYGVDAFDQPGVELGKKLTYGLMGRKGYEDFAKRIT